MTWRRFANLKLKEPITLGGYTDTENEDGTRSHGSLESMIFQLQLGDF